MTFSRMLFLVEYYVSTVNHAIVRFIIHICDKCISYIHPYVSKKPTFEYVPNHLLLTGGLLTTQNREHYIQKLSQAIAYAYDQQIDQISLFLPYSMWHVRDTLDLQNYLQIYLSKLQYKPLISIISGEETVQIENCSTDKFQNPNLQFEDDDSGDSKTVIVAILAPNAKKSRLSATNLLVQLLDERILDYDTREEAINSKTVDSFLKQLPGYNSDSSGYFSRLVDCIINFGGDLNNTVQGMPFWFLRKSLIFNTVNLKNFEVCTFWRILSEYSQQKSKKKIILKDE